MGLGSGGREGRAFWRDDGDWMGCSAAHSDVGSDEGREGGRGGGRTRRGTHLDRPHEHRLLVKPTEAVVLH